MDSCRIYKRATRIECSYLRRLLLRAEKIISNTTTLRTQQIRRNTSTIRILSLAVGHETRTKRKDVPISFVLSKVPRISTNQILSRVFLPIVLRIFTSLRMMTDFTTLFLFSTQTRLGLAVSTSMKVFSLICTLVL